MSNQLIKLAEAGTNEWTKLRSQGIGASEVAAAAGLSPYMTPLELYYRKRGELPDEGETAYRRMGQLLEPIIKSEFSRVMRTPLSDPLPGLYRHPDHAPILATPDAIINEASLLECKTASFRVKASWGEEDTDDVPTAYICQCQQQMAVMGAELVHLAVLFDGVDLRMFKVFRDDELISLLLAAALELWERIKNGDPPEPTWEHSTTPALVKKLHHGELDTRILLNEDEVAAWAEYEELGRIESMAAKRRELVKAKVVFGIGNHAGGILPDGRMVRRKLIVKQPYTVEGSSYFDVRAVKIDPKKPAGNIVPRNINQE